VRHLLLLLRVALQLMLVNLQLLLPVSLICLVAKDGLQYMDVWMLLLLLTMSLLDGLPDEILYRQDGRASS
jgi:hypothetical protein